MNFYERFISLCDGKQLSPSRALLNAGLSKSLANKWSKKPDTIPNGETLGKLASYFEISTDELLGEIKKEPTQAGGLSDKDIKFLEMVHALPDDKQILLLQLAEGLLNSLPPDKE